MKIYEVVNGVPRWVIEVSCCVLLLDISLN